MYKLNDKGMARLANFLENNLAHYQTLDRATVERWANVAESYDTPSIEIRSWDSCDGRTAWIVFHPSEYDALAIDDAAA